MSLVTNDVLVLRANESLPVQLRLNAGRLISHHGEIRRTGSYAVNRRGLPAGPSGFVIWQVPDWSMTIPLTLISLWVLLSKPRQSTLKKTPELFAENNA